jgi:hypothetical protein
MNGINIKAKQEKTNDCPYFQTLLSITHAIAIFLRI